MKFGNFYKVELISALESLLLTEHMCQFILPGTYYLCSFWPEHTFFQHDSVQMSCKWHLHTIVVVVEYALPLELSDRAEFAFLKHICNLLVQEVLLGGMQI